MTRLKTLAFLFVAAMFVVTVPVFAQERILSPASTRLTNDDRNYNKTYSIMIPIFEVPLTNGLLWGFDRYALNLSYARISGETIENNLKNGWEWDQDDFPTNFSLHPYLGSAYFNCARANGYNFYQSAPFALGGSVMWELFMENTKPSYNDLINTTISGVFLGEVLYRLSSNILDDQKTGGTRVLREIVAGLVDPARGFNRLFQGKMLTVTSQEVYQKEPVHFTLAVGVRRTHGLSLATNPTDAILNLNLSYGDPFEVRYRKPFDYFKLRGELASGKLTNVAKTVIGDGFLFGGNPSSVGNFKMLIGGFQHYDYWNTDSFEIGTIGLGGSLLTKVPLFKSGYFQNELHLAAVPLGASNTRKVVVPGETNPGFHNYTYSGGAELKYGTIFNFKLGQLAAEYYLYWLHTYVGQAGDNLIGVFRPKASVRLYGNMNLAYEYFLYKRRDTNGPMPTIRVTTHEQRLYLSFDFR